MAHRSVRINRIGLSHGSPTSVPGQAVPIGVGSRSMCFHVHKVRRGCKEKPVLLRKMPCQKMSPFHEASHALRFSKITSCWQSDGMVPSIGLTAEDESVGESACQASASMPTGMQPSMAPVMPSGKRG